MPLMLRSETRRDGFALWRIVTWLILLLAAYGCMQYALHATQLWRVLQPLPESNTGDILQDRKSACRERVW